MIRTTWLLRGVCPFNNNNIPEKRSRLLARKCVLFICCSFFAEDKTPHNSRMSPEQSQDTCCCITHVICSLINEILGFLLGEVSMFWTASAGSDVVQSGRPIFDDFFQHLWPYIGNNTANLVFQMVKRLWLIRLDK
ncbi:hypothetical protein TNCV_4977421 [Trichonephila clavipes]|nr:hypothetical protein TNCV_4977421 [Trichonephila clavipes]